MDYAFSTISTLKHLEGMFWEDCKINLDTFGFITSRHRGELIELHWHSAGKQKSFSDLIKSIENLRVLSYIKELNCVWKAEQGWFDISIKVEIEEGYTYDVSITLH
tara:strand:- start:353 stop:670 length:318 start_codon:yes stop_codon:yes gene_type:complete